MKSRTPQQQQDPNIFLVKTPVKPTRIIPNFNNPFRPIRPVKTSSPRPQTISFRPSVPVPLFSQNIREPAVRPPPPGSANTFFSGVKEVKTFQQPSEAPPVFFHSEHSNPASRVPVAGASRPSVKSLPSSKPPVKPITALQLSEYNLNGRHYIHHPWTIHQ